MLGVSVGKAALAMARGAGPVVRGIAVAPQLDGKPLPLGWSARDGGHPFVDERSLAAGEAVRDLVYGTGFDDLMLVLISGGASSLIEVLQGDYTLDEYRARIEAAMRSGMPIDELNQLRSSMSSLKAGRLATYSKAPVITLAVSDVIGDAISVIGSGPTKPRPLSHDLAHVIGPMRSFASAFAAALAAHDLPLDDYAMSGLVEGLAPHLEPGIHWGEPTLVVPDDHGDGGRMQQLALELAARIAGTDRCAFCVGSDGIDGPPPANRPAPAGAYVDGTTWQAIEAAGIDPRAALHRRDAGAALAAAGALVITGPTGINHADLVVVA